MLRQTLGRIVIADARTVTADARIVIADASIVIADARIAVADAQTSVLFGRRPCRYDRHPFHLADVRAVKVDSCVEVFFVACFLFSDVVPVFKVIWWKIHNTVPLST